MGFCRWEDRLNVNRDFWSISEKNFEFTKEVIRIRESNLKRTDNTIPSRTKTKRYNNALKTDVKFMDGSEESSSTAE